MEHAWLTTLRPDGSPRAARVWFAEHDDALWIASGEATAKVRDQQRDGRVTVAIEGRHGAMSGTAELRAIDSDPAVIGLLAARYGGWDATDPTDDGPRVLIRIQAHR